jgi:hypothetical protein
VPAKILSVKRGSDGYHVHVHLDTTQQDETGAPHPDWCHEWTWGLPQPTPKDKPLHPDGGHEKGGAFHVACHTQHGQDLTEEQYLDNILAGLPEQVELELHRRRGTSHHHHQHTALLHLEGKEIKPWR